MREDRKTFAYIAEKLKVSYATIYKYTSHIIIKRNPSKDLSVLKWNRARLLASYFVPKIDINGTLLLVAGLYWGEGNKGEFGIINGDPDLILMVLQYLRIMKLEDNEIKISLRLYGSMSAEETVRFWSVKLNYPTHMIRIGEVVQAYQ